jgi:hypothetical protein
MVQFDLLDNPGFFKAENLRIKGLWMFHALVYTMKAKSFRFGKAPHPQAKPMGAFSNRKDAARPIFTHTFQ